MWQGKYLRGVFFQCIGWGLWVAIAGFVIITGGEATNELLPLVPLACGFAGIFFVRYGKRLLAEDASSALAKDHRQPVLLLRPFTVDEGGISGGAGFQLNFEQALISILSAIGPVIAVGRPGERLAPAGAARLYIHGEDWQAQVRRLMDEARVVVLVLFTPQATEETAETQGFQWEIQQTIGQLDPKKLLFVLPEATKIVRIPPSRWVGRKKKELAMQRSFKAFLKEIQDFLSCPIPDDIVKAQFLYFDSEWQPKLLRTRRRGTGVAGFSHTLRPFFQALEISPPTTYAIRLQWRFNIFVRVFIIFFSSALILLILMLAKEYILG